MLTSGGERREAPDFGVDSAGGQARGGRTSWRRRCSGGLQARVSHGKGRGGQGGQVERLTSGEDVRERLESSGGGKSQRPAWVRHGWRRSGAPPAAGRGWGGAARLVEAPDSVGFAWQRPGTAQRQATGAALAAALRSKGRGEAAEVGQRRAVGLGLHLYRASWGVP
jgi:hypothetical protein